MPEGERFTRENLLSHETRRRIFDLLWREPALSVEAIAQRLDIHRQSARYHVQRLAAHDVLEQVPPDASQPGNTLVLHPEDREVWQDERTRVLLWGDGLRSVAGFLLDHGAATPGEVAKGVDRGEDTVRPLLRLLWLQGLVSRRTGADAAERAERGEPAYQPSELLETWGEHVGDRFGSEPAPPE